MFPTDEDTDKVLFTAWSTATVVGGLHLLSLFLDMYLVLVFRKIANLPPDMNPLEDNLTSRRQVKHKHKNSSISAITPLTGDQEKRFSAQSQSTVVGDRNSQVDPIWAKEIPSPTKEQVAFFHTRTQSNTTYSPHTPASARESKERFSMYSQPPSARQSHRNLNTREDLLRRDEDDTQTLAQRKSMLAEQANIKRHSRTNSYITTASKQDFFTPPSTGQGEKHEASGDIALQRNSRESLQNDNWFVHPGGDDEHDDHAIPAPRQSMFHSNGGYNTVSKYDDVSDFEEEHEGTMMPQPLRMNPPTPPPANTQSDEKKNTSSPSKLTRTLTTTSISTERTFDRSLSRSGTPKTRYYGDLKTATQSVLTGNSATNSPSSSPTKGSYRNQPNNLPSATKQYAVNTPSKAKADFVSNSPFTLNKKSYTSIKRTGEANYTPIQGHSPRVVSRSGVDYISPYDLEDPDLGTPGRRRDVSGKIAEEGRGGMWGGMTQRKVSGMA